MTTDNPLTSPRPSGDGASGTAAGAGPFVLRRVGRINAESIDDYIAHGGYAALRKAVTELSPAAVAGEVARAGLRGRGGAGYETAKKWRITAETSADARYAIANAFGADRVAGGDRTLLEGDPHAVLEGLALAAYAVGASRAFVFCCADDVAAVTSVSRAIRQAEERGFLGSCAFGGAFDCHVSVVSAPAGFAIGEETAAIALIEGRRPMPDERPPYPAVAGLHGKPTVVNNAETLANVAAILELGAGKFTGFGAGGAVGTKLVSIVGRLNRPGVVEVPLGTPLRKLIAEFGGGLRDEHRVKAVQIGGACGACLPDSLLDTPLDFDALKAAGASLGSGSLLVLDETACLVDFVRGQMRLLAEENCGRCVPCRLGTERLSFILDKIAAGEGRPGDLELVAELGRNMADGSVCGYGISAAKLAQSALEHFRPEFEAHLNDKQCPAGRCQITAAKTPERREELWKRRWPIRR